MNEAAFLSALHESPNDEVTWLALADWLDDDGQPQRAELVRLVRRLRTLPVMKRDRKRAALEDRVAALLLAGVRPVVPEVSNSIGTRLALIPPGRFRMGSPTQERLREWTETAHEVTLTRAFYLGVFPVTQAQYQSVMGSNPSVFSATGTAAALVAGIDTCDSPVDSISWDEAAEFCRRLSEAAPEKKLGLRYRLPTEAEWEYACRGGASSSGPFHLGAQQFSSHHANFDGRASYDGAPRGPYLARPCAVGSYRPNAFGLYDMHGNVFEWAADFADDRYYQVSPAADPPGPPGPGGPGERVVRIVRGGSWQARGRYCRAASRERRYGDVRLGFHGFRVAADRTG